jgi:hypothetical protein
MMPPFVGAFLTAICIPAFLAGCVAPLRQDEAQTIARERLAKFCRRSDCAGAKQGRTQKIKDRWLVDFDDPRHRFTVTVEDNGNASVSVWNRQ